MASRGLCRGKKAHADKPAKPTTTRLFRMRSDRDAINNDALTDPIAGGRPHESHDLTFNCARVHASLKVDRDFYSSVIRLTGNNISLIYKT